MTTGAKKQLVGSLIESGSETRQVQIIADEVLGDQIIETITDGDTTPSVAVPNTAFKTANTGATTITDLDDGRSGQVVTIIFGDANTTVDFTASGLIGNGGVDWTPAANEQMTCTYDGTDWYCQVPATGGAEVNDLTAAVTWANVPDANITESSVTQHQAALSVTQSQVSDVTATAAEVNLLDLSGLTAGWGLLADTATTASWQALPTGVTDHTALTNIGTNTHAQIDTHLGLTNEHIDWTSATANLDTSGSVSGSTIGGITEGNLLDKAAAETVAAVWHFSGIDFDDNAQLRMGTSNDVVIDFNGTNFVINSALGTTDIDITNFAAINAGTVDADFDAITATSYGGITEANLVDKTAAETISGNWDFTTSASGTNNSINLKSNGPSIWWSESDATATERGWKMYCSSGTHTLYTTTDAGVATDQIWVISRTGTTVDEFAFKVPLQIDDGFYLNERASALADVTNSGQVWTKNTSPQELWFTSDDGVDHHVAGGSLSETFGVVKGTSELVTSSTALQNDDELSISVTNAEVYHWTLMLVLNRVTDAPDCGFKWDFAVPGGSTGAYQWTEIEDGDSAFGTIGAATDLTTDQTLSTLPVSGRVILRMEGTLIAGANGTFQFRWAQNTSSVGSAIVRSGSALMLVR